jgi:hypothetical protein
VTKYSTFQPHDVHTKFVSVFVFNIIDFAKYFPIAAEMKTSKIAGKLKSKSQPKRVIITLVQVAEKINKRID